MKKYLKALSIIAGFAALGAASSHAADQALLDTLVKKGFITSAEAQQIGADSSEFVVKAKGKHTEKIRFRGRLQFQYDYFDGDNVGLNNNDRSRFYFRRLFLGAKGYLANDWSGEIVMDFAGGAAGIDAAKITYEGFENTEVIFGYTKAPFGMEETTSSSKLKPIERSVANRFWADDIDFAARHTGIFINGDIADTGLSYGLSFGNSDQTEGSRDASGVEVTSGWSAFGRVEYTHKFDGGKFLVGFDAGHRTSDWNSGTPLNTSEVTAYNVHGKLNYEGFELAGEYYFGELSSDVAGTQDQEPTSWYVQGAYKFENWEPVIRYSHIDTDNNSQVAVDIDELVRRAPDQGAAASNELTSWYVGMTYYLMGNDLKFQGGYEWAEADAVAAGAQDYEVSGFRGRIQLLF